MKKKKEIIISESKNKTPFSLFLNGEHQIKNATLALTACVTLSNKFPIKKKQIIKGINATKWPGRGQIISNEPLIVFDVAHNKKSVEKYIDLIQKIHKNGRKILLIALQKRKNITDCIQKIGNTFDIIICTKIKSRNPMALYQMKEMFKPYREKTFFFNLSNHAIEHAKEQINITDSLSIIGTHYWGPTINKYFNISFNKL